MCNAKFVDKPKEDNEFLIDRTLRDKLISDHREAFFNWLVEGAKKFFARCEIEIPQSSLDALDEYKSASQDENELYFMNRIEQTYDEKDRIQTSALFADYREWCRDNNVKKMLSQTAFSETMVRKGYKKKKLSSYYFLYVKYREFNPEFLIE